MNKEVKQETNKSSNKVYAIIAVIMIVLALFVIFKPNQNTKNAEIGRATEVQTVEAKEENTIARIDITTPLVDAEKPQFEVYVDGSEIPENQAGWMPKFESQGYVIEKDDGTKDILIKALNNVDISIVLKGFRDEKNGKFIQHWVKYTAFKINGEEILSEPRDIWYGKAYAYHLNAKKGEEYKIHIEWTKVDK